MLTEVGFRLTGAAQPLILVAATVNGEGPREFILDTGAGTSLLSPELAEAAGVRATETRQGMGAGGSVSLSLGRAKSLAVGGAMVEDVQVGILDMSDLGRAVGATIHGDVGFDFLKHFEMTIDYGRNVLRLSRDEPRAAKRGGVEVAFALGGPSKPLVLVPVLVNDQGPFQLALDTGSSTTVLSAELATELRIGLTEIPGVTAGGGHKIKAQAGQVESLAVGAARVRNVAVMAADFLGMLSQVVGKKLDGVAIRN
jgi:predicted aspartyl protease